MAIRVATWTSRRASAPLRSAKKPSSARSRLSCPWPRAFPVFLAWCSSLPRAAPPWRSCPRLALVLEGLRGLARPRTTSAE
eukprot:8240295-Alexandrium_andersonii.AAC.1